jgi:hypothetical protein
MNPVKVDHKKSNIRLENIKKRMQIEGRDGSYDSDLD